MFKYTPRPFLTAWMLTTLSIPSLANPRTHAEHDATSVPVAEHVQTEDSVYLNVEMEEVAVSAVKVNPRNLVPASVSVMGNRQLQQRQVEHVEDLSSRMPNIFIPDYGSSQTTPIIIRGIFSKIKATSVGYYVDGMPHFELSAFDTDMLNIKALEVYRGPQGTLYGRGAIGGVINVYTYSPFEYQGTKVRLRYGNYNTLKAQASHYARFSDKWGLSVNGYYEHRDGYFKNQTLGEKADKYGAGGGRIGLYYRPADRWEVRLTASVDHLNQGGYPYAPYNAETGVLAPIAYNRASGYERLLSTNGLTIKYVGDKVSVNSQTTYQHLHDDQRIDQDFTPTDLYFVTNGMRHNVVSEELTVKSEHAGPLQWVAGTFLFSQTGTQDQRTDYVKNGFLQRSFYDNPQRGAALYAQASYNVWRGLSATAGLRFDYEYNHMNYDRTQTMHADGTSKNTAQFDESLHFTQLVPRFGLQYAWDKENQVFANIAKGYKGGGFNATIVSDQERTYKPEYNWNYEVGAKFATPNRRFSAEATLFYIDWKKQHVSRTVPGVGNVISNAGHSNSKGAELALTYRPLRALTVQGSYGYTYAQFLDYKKGTQDYSDKMVPMVPRHTLSVDLGYTFYPTRLFDSIQLNAGLQGAGKLYWLEDNAVSQDFYLLPTARVEFNKDVFSLALWGKNLSNTKYHSYYFVSSAKYAQEGTPLTFGVDVAVKF